MARSKKLTQDQLDHLDTLCEDYIIAGDDLKAYLEEIITKRNDGYVVIKTLNTLMDKLQDKISKLSEVAETGDWDSLLDDYEGNMLYDEDDGNDDDDE